MVVKPFDLIRHVGYCSASVLSTQFLHFSSPHISISIQLYKVIAIWRKPYIEPSPCLHVVTSMGKMNIVLDDELEKEFRKVVFERKGMKKGNISEALEEAIKQWIEYYYPKKKEEK